MWAFKCQEMHLVVKKFLIQHQYLMDFKAQSVFFNSEKKVSFFNSYNQYLHIATVDWLRSGKVFGFSK